MQVELHQLEMRYERLRKRAPRTERALLTSLAEIGQQTPVVVVGDAERFVLIDGYKRVRALRRLARDVVLATRWELEEVEALLRERGCARSGLAPCGAAGALRLHAGGAGAPVRTQQKLGERPAGAD
jgi:uncharacterized ParB-like nuclease family protein